MSKPFDSTKPVQTRDGRKARIICTDRRQQIQVPIVALIDVGNREELQCFHQNGWADGSVGSWKADLVNIPIKHTRWVNVFGNDGDIIRGGSWYKSETEASNGPCTKLRIACIKIEFEEGEGL